MLHANAKPSTRAVSRALVIGNNPILAFGVVSALGAAAIEADVISDWYAPRLRFSRYCRNYTRVPRGAGGLTARGLAWVKRYCRTHAIDLVIPADMQTTFALASMPDPDALPHFPVAALRTLQTLHDKWTFHQLLERHQLPSPPTQLLDPRAPDALSLRYPIIVKPAAGEGGEGISTCESPQALAALCATEPVRAQRFIAQELIIGHDVDVSVLADHGAVVAHTIQHTESADTKRFVRERHMYEVASDIVRATDFHGIAHFDMRVDSRDGALYVLECNPRVWGSLMYSVWAGVNFVELGCAMALGQLPCEPPVPTERVWHQGVAPRRMLKALLKGRLAPEGMTGATLASWQQAHRDPLTQLIGELTEAGETALRERLRSGA